jgi:dTDP-4-dehydrorhamnose reductase
MRIAVTGREGQLARALARRGAARGIAVVRLGRPALDLAAPHSIAPALAAARPDIVINAAAYTAVDRAEAEPDLAFAINATGAGAVAAAALELGVPVIQISTDYVFDGTGTRAWRESDETAPLNVYGQSKRAGEIAVAAGNARHAILRTAWVYDAAGRNFLRTMLRLAATQPEVRVVADQSGAPTYADDLADGVLRVAETLQAEPENPALHGIFHLTGGGQCSWARFAQAIFAEAAALGGPSAQVIPIATSDYPTPAARPYNSVLDCGRISAAYGIALPPWQDGLSRCIAGMAGTEGWRGA